MGEYGYLSDEFGLEALLETLCDVIDRQFTDEDTRCWLMSAITKLVAQMGAVPDGAADVAKKYTASKSVHLQQCARRQRNARRVRCSATAPLLRRRPVPSRANHERPNSISYFENFHF